VEDLVVADVVVAAVVVVVVVVVNEIPHDEMDWSAPMPLVPRGLTA